MGLPVLDADGTGGRVFDDPQMCAMQLAGIPAAPITMADERDLVEVYPGDPERLGDYARVIAGVLGGRAALTGYNLTAAQARTASVRGSVSLAIRIGKALEQAPDDTVGMLVANFGAHRLLGGEVVKVQRSTTERVVCGSALIEGLGADRGRLLRLEFQHANLVALEGGTVLASVPDIITVLHCKLATAIPTERLCQGQRVTVMGVPCAPVWRTARGVEMASPRAFGYDLDYVPVQVAKRLLA
jgi:uncharacterized protein